MTGKQFLAMEVAVMAIALSNFRIPLISLYHLIGQFKSYQMMPWCNILILSVRSCIQTKTTISKIHRSDSFMAKSAHRFFPTPPFLMAIILATNTCCFYSFYFVVWNMWLTVAAFGQSSRFLRPSPSFQALFTFGWQQIRRGLTTGSTTREFSGRFVDFFSPLSIIFPPPLLSL